MVTGNMLINDFESRHFCPKNNNFLHPLVLRWGSNKVFLPITENLLLILLKGRYGKLPKTRK